MPKKWYEWTKESKILGKGGYGVVYKAKFEGITAVAVKRIELINLEHNRDGEFALKKLDHPNVIKLFQVEADEEFRYYILPLCTASLDKLFLPENHKEKYNGPMPEQTDVLLQLANGLEHIHKGGLIHRDLKHENVLIWVGPEENGSNQVLMKWGDFGLSKSVNERGSHSVSGIKGSRKWMAPEVLKMLKDNTKLFEKEWQQRGTVKSDVFAEALVFGYFLLKGLHLFGSDESKIEVNIREKKPAKLKDIKSTRARNLIEAMLAKQPEERIDSTEVVKQLSNLKIEFQENGKSVRSLLKHKIPNLNFRKIIKMLEENIDVVNNSNGKGFTPLLLLLSTKKQDKNLLVIIQKFIQLGVNVNHVNRDGRNALHYLCMNYRKDDMKDIVHLLIKQRIDIECVDNEGKTALHLLPSNQLSSIGVISEVRKLLIERSPKEISKTKNKSMFSLDSTDYKNENETCLTTNEVPPPNKKFKCEY